MTTCLLCPSPAVADGLCVRCGAKKWAACLWADPVRMKVWIASTPAKDLGPARCDALRAIPTPESSRAFLDRLDAARKAKESLP